MLTQANRVVRREWRFKTPVKNAPDPNETIRLLAALATLGMTSP
jgi:hypothetical protein